MCENTLIEKCAVWRRELEAYGCIQGLAELVLQGFTPGKAKKDLGLCNILEFYIGTNLKHKRIIHTKQQKNLTFL